MVPQMKITFQNQEQIFVNKINMVEFGIIKRMIDYSFPYMMGWNLIDMKKRIEKDNQNDN